ncbi:MAG: hypothetical protein D3922_00425 [Candidatus Electrothrix sp. AR1]|nr:hypothetical protein [Candidatus Electrothrix sp. AR1]
MYEIKQSEKLIRFFDSKIKDSKFKADGKKEIVIACLDVALEHQKAIILLIAKKHFGSASALMRVLFEAWIRALWLNHCATKEEIEKFMKDKLKTRFYKLVEDLEGEGIYKQGHILALKEKCWNTMNSFTHTGKYQVKHRVSESSIGSNFSRENINSLIGLTNTTAVLCFSKMLFLLGKEFDSDITKEIQKIMPDWSWTMTS